MFMFLKFSIKKSLREKEGKCNFLLRSTTWSGAIQPWAALPAFQVQDHRAVPDPYVSQGQRLQHQEGTWGFLIKVSGNSADHACYMQCAPVQDSVHDAGYGTIT